MPSLEERITVLEKKIDFIYQHIVKQAVAKLEPQLRTGLESKLMGQLMGELVNGADKEKD